MTTRDIVVNKDSENDIVYVYKDGFDISKTTNFAATSDIILRLDRSTGKLVGLTIEDFSNVLPDLKEQPEYILMEKFDSIIEFLNASNLAHAKA